MESRRVPKSSNYFDDFLKRHCLRFSPTIAAEFEAIHWAASANILVNQGYARFSDRDLETQPAVGFLLNLLHRVVEHIEAAIVAFTTDSSASSEGLSRVCIELSVSIRYILTGQPESRLLAFFESYARDEEKRLRHWSDSIQSLPEVHKQAHIEAIKHRHTGITAITSVLSRLRSEFIQFGVPLAVEPWPRVAARFEAIGDGMGYRTLYARMSSQVHSDAEETIRYFIGRLSNSKEMLERMAMETFWFSRLMLYLGVKYFLEASAAYSRAYGMDDELAFLDRGIAVIEDELRNIAKNIV